MKIATVAACLLLTGCSVPFVGENGDEEKARCDRIAASAIQTSSLEDAKNLSAQASSCYAALQIDD